MLILLSPAKTLNYSKSYPTVKQSKPAFLNEAMHIVNNIKKLAISDIAKLMDLSDKLAELNHARYQEFPNDYGSYGASICCFKGDVYTDIEVDNYTLDDFNYINKHVAILSGLYGILRPLDSLYPYRLEMGTNTKAILGKSLYEYWGENLVNYLNKQNADYIIDLASHEYSGAIDFKAVNAKCIRVEFKEEKDGKLKAVGIHAKRARGAMTNWIIKNRINQIQDLKKFDLNRYKFNESHSDSQMLIFSRMSK
ncbi:MAG: peroxide stress protein YaaA [Alphaproteobacteria bacterium]|nr:peroxide stress protein YaaA [Alphaproteobacteria bacterium]OJV15123.1 MAG: hypothetical protein BGO27_06765 [Alphaproteobacteria bacterium 33-17]